MMSETRDRRLITEMLQRVNEEGLFTLGPATNRQIIPAIQHIFAKMRTMPKNDPTRKSILTRLAESCQDCQTVQARTILKLFAEITNTSQTLPKQLRYLLRSQLEVAIELTVSKYHPDCDKSHREIPPQMQRPHLKSAYLKRVGPRLGLPTVEDRFLGLATQQMQSKLRGRDPIIDILAALDVDRYVEDCLNDINNQSKTAQRMIDTKTICAWAYKELPDMKQDLWYDDDRAYEFERQDPKKPTAEREYEVFVSQGVMLDVLVQAGMLEALKAGRCSIKFTAPTPKKLMFG